MYLTSGQTVRSKGMSEVAGGWETLGRPRASWIRMHSLGWAKWRQLTEAVELAAWHCPLTPGLRIRST